MSGSERNFIQKSNIDDGNNESIIHLPIEERASSTVPGMRTELDKTTPRRNISPLSEMLDQESKRLSLLPVRTRMRRVTESPVRTRTTMELPVTTRTRRTVESPTRRIAKSPTRRIAESPTRRIAESPTRRTILSEQLSEEKKRQPLPPEMFGYVGGFLKPKEIANFSLTTSPFVGYSNKIPLDLSSIPMTLKKFKESFDKRPKANITGLHLLLTRGESNDFSSLLPFLPRLLKLNLAIGIGFQYDIISQRLKDYIDLEILSRCTNLRELRLLGEYVSLKPLAYCENLSSLTLVNFRYFPEDDVSLNVCTSIESLHLSYVLGEELISQIGSLPNLKELSLKSMDIREIPLSVKLKKLIITNCSKLSSIEEVSNCADLQLFKIAECPILNDFQPLAYCLNLEEVSIDAIAEDHAVPKIDTAIFADLSKLRKLELKGFSFFTGEEGGTEKEASFHDFVSLKELYLSSIKGYIQMPSLPKVGVQLANGTMSGLEQLFLNNLRLREIPKLKESSKLKVISISNSFIDNLDFIKNCSKLIELRLIEVPIESIIFLKNKINLRKLCLFSTYVTDFTPLSRCSLTHFALEPDTDYEKKIENLDGLEKSVNMIDLSLCYVGINNDEILSYFPLLERLELIHLNELLYFDHLADCKRLKYLDLRASMFLKTSLLANMKELISLNLSRCKYVRDLAPLQQCPKLEELILVNSGVRVLSPLSGCQKLSLLDIRELTVDDLEKFQDNPPPLLKSYIGSGAKVYTLANSKWKISNVITIGEIYKRSSYIDKQ